jgi:hypothetical protein
LKALPIVRHARITVPVPAHGQVPRAGATLSLGPGKQFSALGKAAGVQNIRSHDLWHAGATILMTTLGVPDPIVRKVTGHRSHGLERYQHLLPRAASVDCQSDCDGTVSSETSEEGNWHTYAAQWAVGVRQEFLGNANM